MKKSYQQQMDEQIGIINVDAPFILKVLETDTPQQVMFKTTAMQIIEEIHASNTCVHVHVNSFINSLKEKAITDLISSVMFACKAIEVLKEQLEKEEKVKFT